MTYKALRRKSDKQWMMRLGIGVMECDYPIPQPLTFEQLKFKCTKADWSLYELVEVIVIRMDKLPSDEEIVDKVNESINHMTLPMSAWEIGVKECYQYIKSQILKP